MHTGQKHIVDVISKSVAEWEMQQRQIEKPEEIQLAELLLSIPDKDPLGDILNMRRNLERALRIARDGSVYLTEEEVKYWIAGIDQFLAAQPSRES